jgi:tRNA U34 5-methylaminomethyl-2-thiouridine-forming methyltransferase MnmC
VQSNDQQEIKLTADGSATIFSPRFNQHYHSIFGALQESQLVFMDLGLKYALEKFTDINLLEMGFGTGLNAHLAFLLSFHNERRISYTGLEAYPVSQEIAAELPTDLKILHELSWEKDHELSKFFSFRKSLTLIQEFQSAKKFNLVFYDAFAPESQPELWTAEVFEKLASWMSPGGILTTYCSKGYVQRNLKAAGFQVEKHPGPARKREVLRAIR